MSCNPCCCFSFKDSAMTVGIWSAVYSVASLFLFGWQTSVMNNCREVTMSQANLQCEWSCPCVGATTKRTAAIIEGTCGRWLNSASWAGSVRRSSTSAIAPQTSSYPMLTRLGISMICPVTTSPIGRRPRPFSINGFAFAQSCYMGWQLVAINYEMNRAADSLLPNYYEYGRPGVPYTFDSKHQPYEYHYYKGLFVIQVLCLISAFFLLFASCALMYGIHSFSRALVWPWFPCIWASMLSSLAYCIMWWAGDVRDYWLAITILEIIGVFINLYAFVVVLMYFRMLSRTGLVIAHKKDPIPRYHVKPGHSGSRRDLLVPHEPDLQREPYSHRYTSKVQQGYPGFSPYSPEGVPQSPLPLPPPKYAAKLPPYPLENNERINYEREPKSAPKPGRAEDPVTRWVRDQQSIDHGEVNSEPVSPSREVQASFPVKHSRSVPSLYDGSLVSHNDCRHHHHRSSSRRRRCSKSRQDRSRSRHHSSDSDSDTRRKRSGSHRRRHSRSRYAESEVTEDEPRQRHRHERSSGRRSSGRRRSDEDDYERENRRPRREDVEPQREPRRARRADEESVASQSTANPLRAGITIPQHIVIPPSTRTDRDEQGRPLPHKYQINSEITIKYDKNGEPAGSREGRAPRLGSARYQPISIQSNV